MKKLIQIVTAVIISAGFIGSVAGAAPCNSTIDVSGNSGNVNVNCNNIKSVVINCVNNVNIATISLQDGQSGTAVVNGNGSTGSSSTGAVINTNDSTVNANAACATAVATTSPSPSVSPSTSVTPGRGAVMPSEAAPAVLPYTAGNSAAEIVAISLASAAGVVVVSRLAIAAYRRFSVK